VGEEGKRAKISKLDTLDRVMRRGPRDKRRELPSEKLPPSTQKKKTKKAHNIPNPHDTKSTHKNSQPAKQRKAKHPPPPTTPSIGGQETT